MIRSRLVAGVALGALALGALVSTSSASPPGAPTGIGDDAAAATAASRRVNLADLAWRPATMDPNAPVRLIVEVKGDSVAAAEGNAADSGSAFTPTDEARVRSSATAAQDRVANAVDASGGHVERRHLDAINAMTITTTAAGAEALVANADVVKVSPIRTYTRDNGNSDIFTGTTTAWQTYGTTGTGVKLAVIDDGIDYTHADFGGSGNPADFADNDGSVIEPGTFPTAKVIGGYDFVGDDYDAASADPALLIPHPDPDPLACGEHGTHVSGTAAGQGVLADGSTFTGPYDASLDPADFLVSPGSAPQASLMMYRVFGCEGSVDNDVLLAAIDRAVADGADVINMSLGSTWGYADDPDAVAADNAVRAGVVMVVSAGNSGHAAYLVGGPSTGKRVLSVAAVDANASFPGATIIGGAAPISAINANGGPLPIAGTIRVLRDGAGNIALGCSIDDYTADGPVAADTIFVTVRGVCPRVDRASLAQQAGGIGAVMVNTTASLPPSEGNIAGVSIPFIGISSTSAPAIDALDGLPASIDPAGTLANPTYTQAADFTSGGPRSGDSGQKPDVAAPGVGIASAGVGTGTQSVNLSGTSMASPHTAGIAALVVQAHPSWRAEWIKTALVNTADADAIGGFDTRVTGNGLVDPVGAIATDTLLLARQGQAAVNFGFEELGGSFAESEDLTLRNTGNASATYDLQAIWNSDPMGATVTVRPSQVTVKARSSKNIQVTITLSKAAAAALPISDQGTGVTTLRGRIVATPTTADQVLSVPFILTPHSRSDVTVSKTTLTRPDRQGNRTGAITVKNTSFYPGTGDVYNWILSDGRNRALGSDGRAIGVQYFPSGPDDVFMAFAFSTFGRFSAATEDYYDTFFDVDGDGNSDHELLVIDSGLLEAGAPNGVLSTYVFDLVTGDGAVYPAVGAADGSVVVGLAFASDFGITGATAPVAMVAQSVGLGDSVADVFDGYATINPFHPPAASGQFVDVAPKSSASFVITSRAPVAGEVPVKGWMIVSLDDAAGPDQAELVRS